MQKIKALWAAAIPYLDRVLERLIDEDPIASGRKVAALFFFLGFIAGGLL